MKSRCSLPVLARLGLTSTHAQTAPTPAAPAKPADEKTIELSVFEVRADDDVGYQAMNTTSGSRLGTALRDTAASISPFTPEFLSDIAATNVNEMLAYAAKAELNAGDAEGAGFNNPRDFSSAGGEPFRIRGIPGGVSTDYVGAIPEPPEGQGRDMGVMIDLLGDDRFFARVTYFETKQVGDAAVSPSGAVTNAAVLGRSQTLAVNAALVAAGRMTQAQADAASFNWNAASIDTASKGVELELSANPTKNWTIRANYSKSERDRENFFAEGYAFFAVKFAEWRALAAGNPALLATIETNLAAIQTGELDGRAVAQEQGFGSIPHKATLTTRYKFDGSGPLGDRLKGALIGGAVRCQTKAFSQTDTRAASAGGTGKDYYSEGTMFTDAFVGYRFRLPWQKLPASVQVNGRNIFNSDLVSLARYNADFSGARRIYLREPRSLRVTLAVEY